MAEPSVGIVYVPGLEPLLEPGSTCVEIVEIEPQVLWQLDRRRGHRPFLPRRTLEHLRSLPQRKIVHSVSFGAGGSRRVAPDSAEVLSDTIAALDAAWASEHLSFTRVTDGDEEFHTGFLLPPLQTRAGARAAAATIRDLAARLPVPLAVETGVNYLEPRRGELADGEFVARAVEGGGCGILLDLHNVWTNERNGRQPVREFLADLPLDRVWELHVGGGFEFQGYWLDAHSGAVPEPVLEITREIVPSLPNLQAVVYEIFPTFLDQFGLEGVREELRKLREACAVQGDTGWRAAAPAPASRVGAGRESLTPGLAPECWEGTLGELVTGGSASGPLASALESDPGVGLLRKLAWRFRAGAVVQVLDFVVRLVLLHSGAQRLEELLDEYFARSRPEPFASEEALGFLRYLRARRPEIPHLDDVASYEEARIHAVIEGTPQVAAFGCDPRALFEALVEGRVPRDLTAGSYELEVGVPVDSR